MDKIQHYSIIADIFRYPEKDTYNDTVNTCGEILLEKYPNAHKELVPFIDFINNTDFYDIEEIFGKTFHIQSICYLDLGYVLFGEDYKRGEFLVQMKKEQRLANNDCGEELADNLPNVLKLMTLLKDEQFLNELAVRIVIPSISKMLDEFDASRIALKDKIRKKKQKVILLEDTENINVYQYTLQALLSMVKTDFEGLSYNDPVIKPSIGGNFINNCGTCSTDDSHKQNLKTLK